MIGKINDWPLHQVYELQPRNLSTVLFTAACGLLEGVLRYMGQHNLLQSDMRLASFDDHYLYDSLTIPIDTVRQDNRQLAWNCFELIGKLIEGETPERLQRKLKATLQRRYKTEKQTQ